VSSEATTIHGLESRPRTADGTLLPQTFVPNTDEKRLIAELPRLERSDSGHDILLGDTIGRGGMGLVREASQLAIGRRVAVKTLRPEKFDPALTLYLLREAWVTGMLEHPNIVPIYTVGVDANGSPMIVMKRIEGTPWSELIRESDHDLRWHLHILTQVTNAIDFAGSRGIVHRDIKPDNVMVGQFGEVYLLDWGIAVSLTEDHGGRLPLAKDVRGVAGTPGYMAPEMVKEDGSELGVWTDVYLLGALLHELITKEKRHQGGDIGAILLSSLASDPYLYPAHVPPELSAIANRAMHRDPKKRYATAGELRAAIEEFLEHESSRELTDQAYQRLETWKALPEPRDPIAIQNLFGEARFALQQALREWPENARAKRDLLSCLELKFEHDLSRDDFDSASVILDELGERRSDLADRLGELRVRMEKRRGELDGLRKLQAGRNLEVGRRTRAFLMVLQAISFGAIPPLAVLFRRMGMEIGYNYFYATSALKAVYFAFLWIWARDSLSKTAVNRQLSAAVALLIFVEIGIRPFAQNLGHPIEHSLLVDFGVYFLVNATLAITIDRRISWALPAYLAGAMLSYASPENVFWFLGATHFVVGMSMAWVWRPSTIRGPDIIR
jgi:eukaryotic-like serine/threonine-protein kinase